MKKISLYEKLELLSIVFFSFNLLVLILSSFVLICLIVINGFSYPYYLPLVLIFNCISSVIKMIFYHYLEKCFIDLKLKARFEYEELRREALK